MCVFRGLFIAADEHIFVHLVVNINSTMVTSILIIRLKGYFVWLVSLKTSSKGGILEVRTCKQIWNVFNDCLHGFIRSVSWIIFRQSLKALSWCTNLKFNTDTCFNYHWMTCAIPNVFHQAVCFTVFKGLRSLFVVLGLTIWNKRKMMFNSFKIFVVLYWLMDNGPVVYLALNPECYRIIGSKRLY